VLAVLALISARADCAAAPEADGAIAVVVGNDSSVRDVTVDTLREVYLARRRVWPDGSRVIPVNLPTDSSVRDAFSKRVLGRAPRDLASYWNRRYFEGIRPPLVLRSAGAVCAYVAVEPTAIGYLPAADVVRATCRVVLTLPAAAP
jgi:hypothetical protein